jgi:hypothetical protein
VNVRGVAFIGNRKIGHVEDPTPRAGELVIEIKASGMCGSDLNHFRSPTGFGGPPADGPIIAGRLLTWARTTVAAALRSVECPTAACITGIPCPLCVDTNLPRFCLGFVSN